MTREDLEKFKATIIGWITSAGGGAGPFAPSPHDMSSAHHSGNISDAQHGSRTVANAHRHNDMSNIGPNDHHAQQHALDGPDHTGTLDASQLPATAIVEADAGTATPVSVGPSGATAGSGRKYARENHQHIINAVANYIWTGLHTFQAKLTTRDLEPETGELYDIGSVNKRYRTARVAELAATLFSKEEIMVMGNRLIIAKDADTLPSDMNNSQTTYDWGRSLSVGDWLMTQAEDASGNPSTEWWLIGSLVSGTTYNITRNVDGSGANAWPAGTPYVVIGKSGDHRIEIASSNPPSVKLVRQGATWNATTTPVVIDNEGAQFIGDDAADDSSFVKFLNAAMTEYLRMGISNSMNEPTITPGTGKKLLLGGPGGVGGSRVGLSIGRDGSVEVNQAAGGAGATSRMKIGASTLRARDAGTYFGNSLLLSHDNMPGVELPINHYDPNGPILSLGGLRGCWIPRANVAGLCKDASGAGVDMTITNAVVGQSEYGTVPGVTHFDLSSHSPQRYVSSADGNLFGATPNAGFGGWFYINTAGASVQGLCGSGTNANANRQCFIAMAGTNQIIFFTVDSGGTQRQITGPTISTGWHFVVGAVEHNAGTTFWFLSVDGVTYNGTPFSGTLRASASEYSLGRLDGATYPLYGLIGTTFYSNPYPSLLMIAGLYQSTRAYYGV